MELTLINVPKSTIDAIRNHSSQTGDSLDPEALTRVAARAIENYLLSGHPVEHIRDTFNSESLIKGNPAFPLTVRESTSRLLEGYSSIAGVNKSEALDEITDIVSDLIEKVLKDKIAEKLGLNVNPAVVKRQAPTSNFTDTTGISIGLGDMDEEVIEGDSDPNLGVPAEGGVGEDELNHEMDVDDPNAESKGVADGDMDEAQFVEAIAPSNKRLKQTYVDQRVAKRKKGPSKSKGKVIGMTNEGEAERNSF